MGACHSKSIETAPCPVCAVLDAPLSPGSSVARPGATKREVEDSLALHHMQRGLEMSARACNELAQQVPLFGMLFRVIAVACTTALGATHHKKYVRQHAVKVCAYRGWLEPLKKTHANGTQLSQSLESAVVQFQSELHLFTVKLGQLAKEGSTGRGRVLQAFVSDDPLRAEWAAVEDAFSFLQKAIGAESLVDIKGLVDGHQDVQLKLALISAQLIAINHNHQQQALSPPSSPSAACSSPSPPPYGNIDIQLTVFADKHVGLGSRPLPVSNNGSAIAVDADGADDEILSDSTYADPFLEALLAQCAQPNERMRALEAQVTSKRTEELEQQLMRHQKLLAVAQEEYRCAQKSASAHIGAQDATIAELRTSLAQERASAKAAFGSSNDVAATIRRLIPQRPLLPPVAASASSSSGATPASPSSAARAHATNDAPPLCNSHSQAMIKVCSACHVGMCEDCDEAHDRDHARIDFAPFAEQLRKQLANDKVADAVAKAVTDSESRAAQWHQQAVTAQEQANGVQQRIDQEVVDNIVGEVARMNVFLDQFSAVLQSKANSFIERGLAHSAKQIKLQAKFAVLSDGVHHTPSQSDVIVACRLPVLLKDLDSVQQLAKRDELDLQTLTLSRFTNAIKAIGPVAEALNGVADVVTAPMEEATGTWVSQVDGSHGSSGVFKGPWGIALAGGLLYVSDSGNDRVQVFDAVSLAHHKMIGCRGEVAGQFLTPLGLAVAGGLLYVADSGNHRVQVFDAISLAHRKSIGSQGAGACQFSTPCGLAVAGGLLYVADSDNHRVQVFDAVSLAHRKSIGSLGHSAGQLFNPSAVAVAGGLLYVAENGNNHRVQVFDVISLAHHKMIGSLGSDVGQFRGPAGLAVAGGLLYVADNRNNRVQMFDAISLAHHKMISSRGAGAGEFSAPIGLAVAGGLLYVADSGNSRVQVLRA